MERLTAPMLQTKRGVFGFRAFCGIWEMPVSLTKIVDGKSVASDTLWFAKTLADFEISEIAVLPPLFCYNS